MTGARAGTGAAPVRAREDRRRPRLLVVEHEDDAGLGRLAPDLAAELDARRPDRGDPLPPDLDGYHGLVVLGGSMGAGDDIAAPWLGRTRRLLADGVERGLPTLGICLGAQLLAVATGGRVERGAPGLEVGVVEVTLLPAARDDPLLGPVGAAAAEVTGPGTARLAVPQWHHDGVTRLPAGAVPLATGDRYPHQAYRLGGRAWGLQYHPEVTREGFAAWMADGRSAVRAAGLDPDQITRALAAADQDQAVLARAHARAFSGLLADRFAAATG